MTNDVAARAIAAPSPKLAAKIAEVQKAAEVGALPPRHVEVKKDGVLQYTYDYITESTLMEKIRPLLAEKGVATYYSDEILTLAGNVATVRVYLTLVDSESGESFTMSTDGMAADRGDKMVNKAKTGAMRYLLWKWFLVPSAGDDPENESVETSSRPPKAHVKMAKDADVEALAAEVEAAGFDRAKFEETVTAERAQWEGVRQEWLDATRANFETARTAKAEPAAAGQ